MKEAVKIWRIIDILKVTENLFGEKNIDSPRLNAELLLSDTLKTTRMRLYLDFEKPLSELELSDFREKVKRRASREPLQYILGKSEFYGLTFKVNPSVLIPRPETEILVDKTLDVIKMHRLENPKILEIGTGSGCISIAAACKMTCEITAIDSSPEAISISQENSAVNNTASKVSFLHKDIIKDFENFNGYDLIISNPPYIRLDEMETLQEEVKNFEPREALTDNLDGLVFYRKILELAKDTSGKCRILLEIGDGKKQKVESLFKEMNIENYEFFKDMLNIYRVVYIEL